MATGDNQRGTKKIAKMSVTLYHAQIISGFRLPVAIYLHFLTKAIVTGIILLIDQLSAVIFVITDFGTSERFLINSLNLSTNLNCCLVQYNGTL